jgi:hypothetical protein
MHRVPDGVSIVTSVMSISVALQFCLSLSPLIAMLSMMGSGNTLTLRGKTRFLASLTEQRDIAEYSEPLFSNTVNLTQFSAVTYAAWPSFMSAIALLLPKVLKFAFFLSASLFFLYSANMTIASSFFSVRTVRQVVLLVRALLRDEARRRLPGRLLSSASRVRRIFMAGHRSVTVRGLIAATSM